MKTRLEGVARAHGSCRPAPEVHPEEALPGRMRLVCDRGAVEVSVELTSDVPPRIQALVLDPVLPASLALASAAQRAAC